MEYCLEVNAHISLRNRDIYSNIGSKEMFLKPSFRDFYVNIYIKHCLGWSVFLFHTNQVDIWQVKLTIYIVPESMWHRGWVKSRSPPGFSLTVALTNLYPPPPLNPIKARKGVLSKTLHSAWVLSCNRFPIWGRNSEEGKSYLSTITLKQFCRGWKWQPQSNHLEAFSFVCCPWSIRGGDW